MKWVTLVLTCLSLAACGTWKPGGETRIQSNVVVLEYNDLRDQYSPRPTFVSLRERYGAERMLQIRADRYGPEAGDLFITKKGAEGLIRAIAKYDDWAQIAMERGDQINKEIATVKGGEGITYKADFHSGSPSRHFLAITPCSMSCLGANKASDRFYFDREGAERLRGVLVRFASGSMPASEADHIYQ